jgi:hypothetical protein
VKKKRTGEDQMKARILFVAIALLTSVTFGQTGSKERATPQQVWSPQLQSAVSILDVESLGRMTWELTFGLQSEKYKPKTNEDVIKDVGKWLQNRPTKDERIGQIAEYKLMLQYQKNINELFQRMNYVGSDQTGKFLYHEGEVPIRFGLRGNGLTILVTGVASDGVYNILRLTSRQRAMKVISSMILPSLKYFDDAFQKTTIKYYGMLVFYGSDDFLNKTVFGPTPEVVAVVVSASNCGRFVRSELSEDDLLKDADIFMGDRDMATGIKKVKLTLE